MAENYVFSSDTKKRYRELSVYIKGLTEGEESMTANLANASALINLALDRINWCGFYIWEKRAEQLVLGPFQGKPACIRINTGRGVCGTAVKENRIQLVPDVHEFPGHIACDDASRSEIVIPLYRDNELFGVLDIDSPERERFSGIDREGLTNAVKAMGFEVPSLTDNE